MNKTVTLKLPDDLWAAIQEVAIRQGRSLEAVALDWLASQAPKRCGERTPKEAEAALSRFRSHFGAIKSGNTRSADNEQIDADLAREYANTREVKR